jgi:type II secretory pathway pseudopilin PulG
MPTTEINSLYRKARQQGWQANQALRRARTVAAWDALKGYVYDAGDATRDNPYPWEGSVRIIAEPDQDCDLSFADAWSKRDSDALYQRANNDGCWCYTAQFWNGHTWTTTDSICGCIGNSFDGSGYDADLMQSALDAYTSHVEDEARTLEASRPDLYA